MYGDVSHGDITYGDVLSLYPVCVSMVVSEISKIILEGKKGKRRAVIERYLKNGLERV